MFRLDSEDVEETTRELHYVLTGDDIFEDRNRDSFMTKIRFNSTLYPVYWTTSLVCVSIFKTVNCQLQYNNESTVNTEDLDLY